MPTFQAVSDDEQRMSTYILQRCPPELKADLDSYMSRLLVFSLFLFSFFLFVSLFFFFLSFFRPQFFLSFFRP